MDLSQSGVVHPQNKRQKVALENSAPPADIKRYYESYSEGETVTAESTGNYTPEDDVINSPETMQGGNRTPLVTSAEDHVLCEEGSDEPMSDDSLDSPRSNLSPTPHDPYPPKDSSPAVRTQRSIGARFNANCKIFRIVLSGKDDPLISDEMWTGLCLDMVAVGFLSDGYRESRQGLDDYVLPLAMQAWGAKQKWAVYSRAYKKMPFEMGVKLSIFRWVCRVMMEGEADEAGLDRQKEIAAAAQTLLRKDLFSNDTLSCTSSSSDVYTKAVGEGETKLRISMTEEGKSILCVPYNTFQPRSPNSLIQCVKNTLRRSNFEAYLDEKRKASPAIYLHEEMHTPGLHTACGPCLSKYSMIGTDILKLRKTILVHLVAWDEGAAGFGMKQLWGDTERYHEAVRAIQNVLFVPRVAVDEEV